MGLLATGLLDTDTLALFSDAFSGVQTDVLSMVGKALPVGLGIMGLFLAIRLGVGFFKSIAH